jgi:lipid A 3-O-deacylase
MKRLLTFLFIFSLFSNYAYAGDEIRPEENPAFLGRENQIRLDGGVSIGSKGIEGYRKVHADGSKTNYTPNLIFAMFSYSQPNTFFRVNGRRSIELGGMRGREHGRIQKEEGDTTKNYSRYNQVIGGAMQEFVFGGESIYATAGIGIYYASKATDRIGSRFSFGERVGLGFNAGAMNIEAFARHFSNGSVTKNNSGQNFVGLSLAYKF